MPIDFGEPRHAKFVGDRLSGLVRVMRPHMGILIFTSAVGCYEVCLTVLSASVPRQFFRLTIRGGREHSPAMITRPLRFVAVLFIALVATLSARSVRSLTKSSRHFGPALELGSSLTVTLAPADTLGEEMVH
jgi:hypothetical protein